MRVQLQNDESTQQFAKNLLDIINGKMAIDELTRCIKFPTDFCIITQYKEDLIQCVFPSITQNYKSHQWLSERIILAANNVDVIAININIQNLSPDDITTYKLVYTVITQHEAVNYPTKFLSSFDLLNRQHTS